ncbi:MAG: hypothetical protein ABWZ64_07195 [Xanthobacteraceae bacterium]|jgi:hypothetical protein
MKMIAVAVAIAFGVAALGSVTPADAAKADGARYKACWKKVMPQRSYGPGAIVSVDRCARGMPW